MSRLERLRKELEELRIKSKQKSKSITKIDESGFPNNGYIPTETQRKAHFSKETYILFGGAMGGGKSAWLVNEAIRLSLKYPGNRGYLCRHELSSFKKTTLLELEKWIPIDLITKHNKSENFIEFKNGSRIYYGGLGDDIRSIERLKSMELGWFGIEQAEETTEKFFLMLAIRLRLKVPGIKYRGLLTANPSPNWVRSRFVDKKLNNHIFIPSFVKDNPFLPSDYEERLKEVLPEELVEVWLKGDWNAISSENNVFAFDKVIEAMRRQKEVEGQVIFSCDPGRYGSDETVIVKRSGNSFEFVWVKRKCSTMEIAGKLVQLKNEYPEAKIFVDSIGIGAGVVDRLREQGIPVVEVVNSAKPRNPKKFKNKRAENYWKLREILDEVALPNDEKLKAQMLSIRYRILSDGLILIESKEELKKRGLPSPDRLDAIVNSFDLDAERGKLSTLKEKEYLLPRKVAWKGDEREKICRDFDLWVAGNNYREVG
jgi:hypothetical protein